MSEEKLEITKDGVRLSYSRFLADSAGGYVLLLLVFYLLATAGVAPPSLTKEASSALLVFAGLFILLLGPPFGLALNSISWFLLGSFQARFINRWPKGDQSRPARWLMFATYQFYQVDRLRTHFEFLSNPPSNTGKRESLYSQISELSHVMRIYFPHLTDRIEYLNGIKIFVRNLSLITLIIFATLILSALASKKAEYKEAEYVIACVLLPLSTILLTKLANWLELYRSLEFLFTAFVLTEESRGVHARARRIHTSTSMPVSTQSQGPITFEGLLEKLGEVATTATR